METMQANILEKSTTHADLQGIESKIEDLERKLQHVDKRQDEALEFQNRVETVLDAPE